jgi:3-methyl-2-oxobutanoate hydroxymethyltransferase
MSSAPVTTASLLKMKRQGEKIAALTCYDASFTQVLEAAGVEVLLVGDSLGMVVQGRDSTLPVRVGDMVYHSRLVSRARRRALVVTDMPFLSYASPAQALATAARLMKQGGAHMVKLEGGAEQMETVQRLSAAGVPVCAHLGLLPQSVHKLGGYRVQGRDQASAQRLREDALALQEAGAGMLVLECVPAALASEVSASLDIPVIGIGAGPGCDGQVLVLYDMLGITPGKRPSFTQDFLASADGIEQAVDAYVQAVKRGVFPTREQSFD